MLGPDVHIRELHVSAHHHQRRVPQQLLKGENVAPGEDEAFRPRVSERVWRDRTLSIPAPRPQFGHHLLNPSARTSAVSSNEERVARPQILHDAPVSTQGVRRGPPERNVSFLSALPHDPEHAFVEIDVLGIQADEFRDSDQGIEKDEQDRPISGCPPRSGDLVPRALSEAVRRRRSARWSWAPGAARSAS
jgi:hypothetical protein